MSSLLREAASCVVFTFAPFLVEVTIKGKMLLFLGQESFFIVEANMESGKFFPIIQITENTK